MPTAGDYAAYQTALLADVKAAWPEVLKVHFGWPRSPQSDLPYAVCVFEKVTSDLGGDSASVNTAHQVYAWTIILVSPIPAVSENLQGFKVEKGDAIVPYLEGATNYAGVGMNPIVAEIDYSERWEFPGSEAACTVTVSFLSMVRRQWGT